jgi:branched-chain amino acid transport system permease protein
MSTRTFAMVAFVVAGALIGASLLIENAYFFTAAYAVLVFVILATAWNILGGYTGYVNFGTPAFFALGVYTTVFMYNYFQAPLVVDIICGTAVAGLAGLAVGYLTLRLRGVFFAIATLALAVVLLTFIVNWEYVGGARGAYVITRDPAPLGLASWKHYLYVVIMILTTIALVIARMLEHSKIGRGLAAIRDDELAAECAGVPTLRLKLLSAAASGGLMGMAGTTYPYFYAYAEPTSVFNLSYAVNSIAMPMIGGMTSWLGPLIGALLLGTLQQVVQVTITSNLNLLITGVLLVLFVTLAPNGILGWFDAWKRRRR